MLCKILNSITILLTINGPIKFKRKFVGPLRLVIYRKRKGDSCPLWLTCDWLYYYVIILISFDDDDDDDDDDDSFYVKFRLYPSRLCCRENDKRIHKTKMSGMELLQSHVAGRCIVREERSKSRLHHQNRSYISSNARQGRLVTPRCRSGQSGLGSSLE